MVKRLLCYIWDSYLPLARLVLTLEMCYSTYLLFRTVNGIVYPSFSYLVLITTVILNLFLLYSRITDEFKDSEIDKKFFPTRPVPAGKVTFKDLQVLKYFIVALLFVINAIFYRVLPEFFIAFALFFLMGKYFFVPGILEKNRILTFLTHTPTYAVLFYYLIIFYARYSSLPAFNTDYIFIAVWIWIPVLIWEFSRKTRSPEEEQAGYQTYSTMLGAKGAALIIMILIITHIGYMYIFINQWRLSWIITSIVSALAFILLICCVRFIKKPTKKTNHLKFASEFYQMIVYILVIINGLVF